MTKYLMLEDDDMPYMCHYCNTPLAEDDIEFITEYNCREYYFCSKSCMSQWESADTSWNDEPLGERGDYEGI